MIHIKRRTQIKIVMYIILLALGGTLFVINRVYDFTKSKSPSISDVQYNQLDDSIFISCEVKSSDVIDYVEIGYDHKTVEMKCSTTINHQWNKDRYNGTIPLVDESVEVRITAYDKEGDSTTYIIEK